MRIGRSLAVYMFVTAAVVGLSAALFTFHLVYMNIGT